MTGLKFRVGIYHPLLLCVPCCSPFVLCWIWPGGVGLTVIALVCLLLFVLAVAVVGVEHYRVSMDQVLSQSLTLSLSNSLTY